MTNYQRSEVISISTRLKQYQIHVPDVKDTKRKEEIYGPRQANLCLRAFRHDKFQLRMSSHSEGPGIWFSV